MNERFYRAVRAFGRQVIGLASRPRILHAERAARGGAYLLAANHASPLDPALLIAATPRVICWLSIVEIFGYPLVGRFLHAMGAEPLDRSRVDTRTVRAIVRRLRAGRVVGIFPEGSLRPVADSVLQGGTIDDGVCKLATLAAVPVLPCVVLGGERFARWQSWLPGAATRWAVAFGEPIFPGRSPDRAADLEGMRAKIQDALRALRDEIAADV